jgi:hypothetical protein
MNSSFVRVLQVAAAVGAIGAIAACGSDSSAAGTGTMAVQLTDAPFSTDSVQSVDIFVVRVDGRRQAADSAAADSTADEAGSDGWITLAQPNASVNLLDYQNGVSLPVGETDVAAGSYSGFRLVIDPTKSSVTLKNGEVLTGSSSPGVTFPSASRSGLKINLTQPITVISGDTTTVLVDFNVGSSFVLRGNSLSQNGLLFKPVINATVK